MQVMRPRTAFFFALLAAASIADAADSAVEPIHFKQLIEVLPSEVEGYTAGKDKGSTTAAMGFKITNVERPFTKDTATVKLKITDGAGSPMFGQMHAFKANFDSETMEGYDKAYELDGQQAVEEYKNDPKKGSLNVFYKNRFMIAVEVRGLPAEALREWFARIDLAKLDGMVQ